MSTYKYPESKVIDEVIFKKTAQDSVRAYLHAKPDADRQYFSTTVDTLRDKDFECIPYTLNGQSVLEVRGFKSEINLIRFLKEHKLIEGDGQAIHPPEEKIDWKEKLKKRSLQATGALYAVGDVSFFGYGFLDNSPLDMAAGVLYGLPTPVLLAYGKNDQSELQIKDTAKKMAAHFRKEVDNLPQDCGLYSLTHDQKQGPMQHVAELLQRYPSEFMNICYGGAGLCIALAAKKHLAKVALEGPGAEAVENWLAQLHKTNPHATREMAYDKALHNTKLENYFNMGVGGMTIASGAFGALVKEKARDPDEPKKPGFEGIVQWVRERPLAITGTGYMVSTLLHAAATAVAIKGQDAQHKKAVPLRALFVGSALLAELMVAMSSKGHGEGVISDKSVDHSVVAIAADIIVKQPKAAQNALIEYMGGFLGQPDVLAISDEKATRLLREEVEKMQKNPWSCVGAANGQDCTVDAKVDASVKHAPKSVAIKQPYNKKDIPAGWQAKIASGKASDAGLQPTA